ncbi:MAG: hypothetical protein AAB874_06205 [Patescibacteria group bacterium]
MHEQEKLHPDKHPGINRKNVISFVAALALSAGCMSPAVLYLYLSKVCNGLSYPAASPYQVDVSCNLPNWWELSITASKSIRYKYTDWETSLVNTGNIRFKKFEARVRQTQQFPYLRKLP